MPGNVAFEMFFVCKKIIFAGMLRCSQEIWMYKRRTQMNTLKKIIKDSADYLFWYVMTGIIFRSYIADSIHMNLIGMQIAKSQVIMIWRILMIIMFVINMYLKMKSEDIYDLSCQDIYLAVVPMGIILVFKYIEEYTAIVFSVSFLLAVFSMILIYRNWHSIVEKSRRAVQFRIAIINRLLEFSNVTIVILFVLTLCARMLPFYAIEASNNSNQQMDNWNQIYSKLDEDTWRGLNEKEKITLLQKVVDIECSQKLKCEKITLSASKLSDGTLGGYNENLEKNKVYIDRQHMNSSDVSEVVNTVIHETFHAYCYQCVLAAEDMKEISELMYFFQLSEWKNNFENYISPEESYIGYATQPLERDARAYADERTKEILMLNNVEK